MFSGSPTIAIGATGSKPYNPGVTLNIAGNVFADEDLITTIVNGKERHTRRSFGTSSNPSKGRVGR